MQSTLPSTGPIDQLDGEWHLVQTRPKYEFRLGRELFAAGINFFLPTYTRKRVKTTCNRTQVLETESALFPAYLFVCGNFKSRDFASRSRATTRITAIADQSRFRRELLAVQKALYAGGTIKAANRPRVGEPVEIIAGPLVGHRGIVERIGSHTVHLPLSILGGGVETEIRLDFIRPLEYRLETAHGSFQLLTAP